MQLSFLGHAGHNHFAGTALDSSSLSNEQMATIWAGIILFSFLAVVVAYVITSFCISRIFKKAGIASWKGWVPIYNVWNLLELGGQKGFWAVLALVPIVNFVSAIFLILAMYRIGLKFGKSELFVLLAIFLPMVWYIWLAVDGSKWQGKPAKKSA